MREPLTHLQAKLRAMQILHKAGYDIMLEWPTPRLLHKGKPIPFPIDVAAHNIETGDQIMLQLDGSVHRGSKIKIGKTENRDDTQERYAQKNNIRYVTLSVEDVLSESNRWIKEKLGIIQ